MDEHLALVISYLDTLSDDVKIINISNRKLKYLPNFERFKYLECLICSNNKLENLYQMEIHTPEEEQKEETKEPKLDANGWPIVSKKTTLEKVNNQWKNHIYLTEIYCDNNNLWKLFDECAGYPPNLKKFYCNNNRLQSLNFLPVTIETLYCHNNQLRNELPSILYTFHCKKTDVAIQMKKCKFMKLRVLFCQNNSSNELIHKQFLPNTLEILYCNNLKNRISPKYNVKIYNYGKPDAIEESIDNTTDENDLHIPNSLKVIVCYHNDGKTVNKNVTLESLHKKRQLQILSKLSQNDKTEIAYI